MVPNTAECARQVVQNKRRGRGGDATEVETNDLYAKRKRQFYRCQKLLVLRAIEADARRAEKVTNEEIEERKEKLCEDWGVPTGLEAEFQQMFKPGYCFICDESFLPPNQVPGLDGKAATKALNKHLKSEHCRCGSTRTGAELLKRYKTDLGPELRAEEERVCAAHQSSFIKDDDGRFRCLDCDVAFTTNCSSMMAHAQHHAKGGFVKIWKRGLECVPTEHARRGNGELWAGPGAKFDKVLIPPGVRWVGGKVRCRKCNKFEVNLSQDMPANGISKSVNEMDYHERFCTGKRTLEGGEEGEGAEARAEREERDRALDEVLQGDPLFVAMERKRLRVQKMKQRARNVGG